MAAESSRSSSSADSYIGSLISLTSKSEMRYEGVLYNINTDESSIGLQNVRSFGTEGRKKDGPQVPPSDKVYEYILFRGSDIKDLQVKSSPPVQTSPPINNDPAIIQSHYSRPASTSTSLPPAVTGSLTDLSSHTPLLAHPGSSFQGSLPLYQPGGNLGSWGPSPTPPGANGSGLAMPMYWQGFYGPPNGLPQLHQQSLLRPPPGLSMPPSMQPPMQYSGFTSSLPPGASNLPGSNLPEYPSPLFTAANTNSLNLASTSLPPSTLSSPLPPAPSSSSTLSLETLPISTQNKVPNVAPPTTTLSANLPALSTLIASTPETSAVLLPISNKPNAASGPTLSYQALSQPMSSILGSSSSSQTGTPTPSLVTPGQLLQSGLTAVSSSQSSPTTQKDVEVVQVSSSSEVSAPVTTEAQPPLLPLPQASRAGQKFNGAPFQSRQGYYRGRERGRGPASSRSVTKFAEDFDFMAMNEKFKKDEVWGHLGKSNRSHLKDIEGDGNGSDEDGYQDEEDAESPKCETKPVYNKDDFFDTLSCNALDQELNNGRTRFSEQMKIDTETFGEFSRYRGGRGGRWPGRGGGRSRGNYYGRGYGYMGRGRGRGMPSHAS
ncbi:hypothetical protein Vadar_003890 [Vaccinium darrowii]|uniref:Uncharacterized protein n=1 Tax=Vaccinium darrowii TaxID=229202 RepID=A0ACB7XFA8_9ERIC|nr:hypothetical protein Vadar_003890 [Vaccinium darrowii]